MANEGKPTVLIAPLSGGPLRRAEFNFEPHHKERLNRILAEAFQKLDSPPSEASVRAFMRALEFEIGRFKILTDIEHAPHPGQDFGMGIRRLERQSQRLEETWNRMCAENSQLLWICLEFSLNSEEELAELAQSASQGMSWKEFTTGVKGPDDSAQWASVQQGRARRRAAEKYLKRLTTDLATLRSIVSQVRESHEAAGHTKPAVQRKAGRHKEYWRRALATSVASSFSDCLGFAPTSTAEGPFESVLRVVLESASVHVEDLHRFTMEAVRQWQVHKSSSS